MASYTPATAAAMQAAYPRIERVARLYVHLPPADEAEALPRRQTP